MEKRLLLDKINYAKGTIMIDGKEYKLLDKNFPTINPENPYELTKREKEVIDKLVRAYTRKVDFLRELQGGVKIYSYNYLNKHNVKLR